MESVISVVGIVVTIIIAIPGYLTWRASKTAMLQLKPESNESVSWVEFSNMNPGGRETWRKSSTCRIEQEPSGRIKATFSNGVVRFVAAHKVLGITLEKQEIQDLQEIVKHMDQLQSAKDSVRVIESAYKLE